MADLVYMDHPNIARLAEDPTMAPGLISQLQREQQRFIRVQYERTAANDQHLNRFERRYSSQNGEDGILEEIFRRIGVTNSTFIEFGVEDGRVNNTRRLLESGWRGIWLECDPSFAKAAREQFEHMPVQILERRITVQNCLEVFSEAQAPTEMDLLSIDIDGNDYWVWQRLGSVYRPRVVVMEYNAAYLPEQRWIMPYNPNHQWDGTNWFGSSLSSLADLAEQLGYSLVTCDSQGVNAFFVRQDLLQGAFLAPGDVAFHYCAPRYSFPWLGHPPSTLAWSPPEPPYLEHSIGDAVTARWAGDPLTSVESAALFNVSVWVKNTSSWAITSNAAYSPPEVVTNWNAWRKPPWLAARWKDQNGEIVPVRNYTSFITPAIAPQCEEWYAVTSQAPAQPGSYTLVVCLVHSIEQIQGLLETPVTVV